MVGLILTRRDVIMQIEEREKGTANVAVILERVLALEELYEGL